MSTALTVYAISTASSTLSTAQNLISAGATGAIGSNNNTAVGLSPTGWGEIVPLGTASAWAAAGSQGSPTGKGLLFDVTTLEGQDIIAGNWTPTINLKSDNAGTLNGTLVIRYYKRSSGGVYTLIGSNTLTSQSLTSTATSYVFSAASLSLVSFATGDKLYIDVWMNITSTSSTASNTGIGWKPSSLTTSGWTGSQFVTPGYQVTSNATSTSVTETTAVYDDTAQSASIPTVTEAPTSSEIARSSSRPALTETIPLVESFSSVSSATTTDTLVSSDTTSFSYPSGPTLQETSVLGETIQSLSSATVTETTDTSGEASQDASFVTVVETTDTSGELAQSVSTGSSTEATSSTDTTSVINGVILPVSPGLMGTDTFAGRTVASGLGTASDGQGWSAQTGNSTISVGSGEATFTGGLALNILTLGSAISRDFDITVRGYVSSSADQWGIIARYLPSSTYYKGRLRNGNLEIVSVFNNQATTLIRVPYTYSVNTFYFLRFIGVGPNLLIKAWASGSPEATYTLATATETNNAVSGQYGIMALVAATTDTIQLDSFYAVSYAVSETQLPVESVSTYNAPVSTAGVYETLTATEQVASIGMMQALDPTSTLETIQSLVQPTANDPISTDEQISSATFVTVSETLPQSEQIIRTGTRVIVESTISGDDSAQSVMVLQPTETNTIADDTAQSLSFVTTTETIPRTAQLTLTSLTTVQETTLSQDSILTVNGFVLIDVLTSPDDTGQSQSSSSVVGNPTVSTELAQSVDNATVQEATTNSEQVATQRITISTIVETPILVESVQVLQITTTQETTSSYEFVVSLDVATFQETLVRTEGITGMSAVTASEALPTGESAQSVVISTVQEATASQDSSTALAITSTAETVSSSDVLVVTGSALTRETSTLNERAQSTGLQAPQETITIADDTAQSLSLITSQETLSNSESTLYVPMSILVQTDVLISSDSVQSVSVALVAETNTGTDSIQTQTGSTITEGSTLYDLVQSLGSASSVESVPTSEQGQSMLLSSLAEQNTAQEAVQSLSSSVIADINAILDAAQSQSVTTTTETTPSGEQVIIPVYFYVAEILASRDVVQSTMNELMVETLMAYEVASYILSPEVADVYFTTASGTATFTTANGTATFVGANGTITFQGEQ